MDEIVNKVVENTKAAGLAMIIEMTANEYSNAFGGMLTYFSHTETDGEAEVVLRVNFKEAKDEAD